MNFIRQIHLLIIPCLNQKFVDLIIAIKCNWHPNKKLTWERLKQRDINNPNARLTNHTLMLYSFIPLTEFSLPTCRYQSMYDRALSTTHNWSILFIDRFYWHFALSKLDMRHTRVTAKWPEPISRWFLIMALNQPITWLQFLQWMSWL